MPRASESAFIEAIPRLIEVGWLAYVETDELEKRHDSDVVVPDTDGDVTPKPSLQYNTVQYTTVHASALPTSVVPRLKARWGREKKKPRVRLCLPP